MGAISALRTTGGALARNPIIFVGTFIVALVGVLIQAPRYVVQAPLVSVLVGLLGSIALFFVSPFLLGGILGMATEAITDRTSLGTFVRVGKTRYVTLLLATLLYGLLVFALLIAFAVIGVIAAVVFGFVLAGSGGDPGVGALVALALVVLALLVAFFLFYFFFQFFSVAVVVDEASVAGSFSQSYRLVRRNLLSTLGYVVLRLVLGVLILVPFLVVLVLVLVFATAGILHPPSPAPGTSFDGFGFSTVALVVVAVGFFVLQTVLSAIMSTYAVAFYRDRRAPNSAASESQRPQRQSS